ncbi:MAG TPA: hypothetical protein VFA15_03065, partial [Nitrososphaera sp.]|nr:hypothetical protein [Nitrososphaera sp.]
YSNDILITGGSTLNQMLSSAKIGFAPANYTKLADFASQVLKGAEVSAPDYLLIGTANKSANLWNAWSGAQKTLGGTVASASADSLAQLISILKSQSSDGAKKFQVITISGHGASEALPGVSLAKGGSPSAPPAQRLDLKTLNDNPSLASQLSLALKNALVPGGVLRFTSCGYSEKLPEGVWQTELTNLAKKLGVIVGASPVPMSSQGFPPNYGPFFGSANGLAANYWVYGLP